MKIEKPKVGGVYKHFKGNHYKVLGIVRHSETEEEMVLYLPLYLNENFPGDLWVRPIGMFLEIVERDGKKFPRFELVNNS